MCGGHWTFIYEGSGALVVRGSGALQVFGQFIYDGSGATVREAVT